MSAHLGHERAARQFMHLDASLLAAGGHPLAVRTEHGKVCPFMRKLEERLSGGGVEHARAEWLRPFLLIGVEPPSIRTKAWPDRANGGDSSREPGPRRHVVRCNEFPRQVVMQILIFHRAGAVGGKGHRGP